jgi:uroporphyrinogen decarboxylase
MHAKLTSAERVLAVLRLEEPDRVPHFEWEYHPRTVQSLTRGGSYFDLVELLDIDAVMVAPQYRTQLLGEDLLQDEWGAVRRISEEGGAIVVDDRALIKSIDDLNQWQPPNPDDPFRYENIEAAVRRFGGMRAICLQIRDVWSPVRDYLGYVPALMSLLDQPELVDGIIKKCVDHNIRIIECAAEIGIDLVMSGDDLASSKGPLFSPTLWEGIFIPHYQRLITAIHNSGLFHWKHSDGNLYPFLDSIVDAGSDGIDPVDPLGGMELRAVKAKYGDRVAIKGNIDQVELLVSGQPAQVVEAVKTCILDGGIGGGYVCSSSNMIHSDVNPELYRVMVEAIHRYGKYPLDMELLAPEHHFRKSIRNIQ